MFRCRRKKVKSDASVLFIFIAAVGTLILATAVLKISPVKRTAVEERPPSVAVDSGTSLPDGINEPVQQAELNLLAEPTTALAYRQSGRQMLGLMQWDRRAGKNILKSNIVLRGVANELELPELSAERYGWGKDSEIELRWATADSSIDMLSYAVVDGTQLNQVRIERPDGVTRYELMEVGESPLGKTSIEVKDVDSDGVAELFAITIDSEGNRTVDVYLWTDNRLSWSSHWSKAMTARDGMFPEPVE